MKRNLCVFLLSILMTSTLFAGEWRRISWDSRVIYDRYEGRSLKRHVIILFPKQKDGSFEITFWVNSAQQISRASTESEVLGLVLSALRSQFPDFPDIVQEGI